MRPFFILTRCKSNVVLSEANDREANDPSSRGSTVISLKRQPLKDNFRNMLNHRHNVAPDLRRVQNIGRTVFKSAHDVASNQLRIGKTRGIRQMIGHWGLYRPWLNGNNSNSRRVKPASQPLKEQ